MVSHERISMPTKTFLFTLIGSYILDTLDVLEQTISVAFWGKCVLCDHVLDLLNGKIMLILVYSY